jgi:UDP-2,3-diacylglucosamine pyrophosphatase LpxH
MILHEFKIRHKQGESITLKPLADVHLGNSYCDVKAFKEFLRDTAQPENTYYIGIGDLMDSIIVKDVKRYVKHADASETDAVIDEQVNEMAEILRPYRERIIGLGTGNHENAIVKHCGTDPMKRLCTSLNVPYLGFSWLTRIIFTDQNKMSRTVIVRGHHGWGGGSRTQGADLTKFARDTGYWDADIFLYGHVHRRQADKIDRMSMAGMTLIPKPKHMFICGTFLKTFSLTADATYSEEKGYPPVSIGGIDIHLTPLSHGRWVKVENSL